MNETEAIYKIVLRNLNRSNWEQLLPEAQFQMVEEVAELINSNSLPNFKRQQLSSLLKTLESYVADAQRKRICQILGMCWEEMLEVYAVSNNVYLTANSHRST